MKRLINNKLYFIVLALIVITGCDIFSSNDKSQTQLRKFDVVGVKHNKGLKEVFNKLKAAKKENKSVRLTGKEIFKMFRGTATYENLDNSKIIDQGISSFGKKISDKLIKSGKIRTKSLSKKNQVTIQDLHEANILGDKQVYYINQIKGSTNISNVKEIALRASQRFGRSG